ncbi:hypothetical protein NQZ68_000306 [Dissostichus eleginoides]|nr:hypothetical protein NQZ68_000306 [Dissostichus eleginoides]
MAESRGKAPSVSRVLCQYKQSVSGELAASDQTIYEESGEINVVLTETDVPIVAFTSEQRKSEHSGEDAIEEKIINSSPPFHFVNGGYLWVKSCNHILPQQPEMTTSGHSEASEMMTQRDKVS